MNWLRTIRDNARDRRQLKSDLSTAEFRLKSVSIVYKALEIPGGPVNLFICASTPREGAFVCNLKPKIVKKIRGIILEDLDKTIDAELKYIKEMEVKL